MESVTSTSVKAPPAGGLFLFQSRSQFVWAAVGAALVYCAVAWIPGLQPSARSGATTGGIGAILVWLVFVFPARFEWQMASPNRRASAYEKLREMIERSGYSEFEPNGFSTGLPAWARDDWNVIRLAQQESSLVVAGPWMVVSKLRKQAAEAARIRNSALQ
jgi:hypothetical protein